jgi:hypothetical protein
MSGRQKRGRKRGAACISFQGIVPLSLPPIASNGYRLPSAQTPHFRNRSTGVPATPDFCLHDLLLSLLYSHAVIENLSGDALHFCAEWSQGCVLRCRRSICHSLVVTLHRHAAATYVTFSSQLNTNTRSCIMCVPTGPSGVKVTLQ